MVDFAGVYKDESGCEKKGRQFFYQRVCVAVCKVGKIGIIRGQPDCAVAVWNSLPDTL